ncbi:MAG: hypothetical protein JW939_01320, partial [Candidatus Thermoplasmatota archaeon]|nr:hypothetical protein [Candidatus Thermoplasmatota archaeon]
TFRISAVDSVGVTRVEMNINGNVRTMTLNTMSGYHEYVIDTRTMPDGTYSINATAWDVAGRRVTTSTIQFRIDNTAPELLVETPVKDQLISGLFVVRARTTDQFPGLVKYAIDGTTWYDVTTPWNSTLVSDGVHTISIRTEDQAGHPTQFNVNVIVDNSAPVISQASITPGQTLSGIKTLRFYAYDSIGLRDVTLSIDGAAAFEIYRGEGGMYYEFLLDTRTLSDGDHTIDVTASDRAENTMGETYGIRVDNTGPSISLDYYWIEGSEEVRIGNVKEGTSVVFRATVIDPSGIGVVMINIDSTGWREMSPDTNDSNPDTYVIFWPTSDTEGGSHVFHIRTADRLGNEATLTGLINVKEKHERTPFIVSFNRALPMLWFILFIILIIALALLAYFGILVRFVKGDLWTNRSRKEKAPEGGDDIPEEKKTPKSKNPFKPARRSEDKDVEDWDDRVEK